jgi:hypothetical protein
MKYKRLILLRKESYLLTFLQFAFMHLHFFEVPIARQLRYRIPSID